MGFYPCEICDNYKAEKRKDEIHVCDECNKKYPIKE